MASFFSQVSSFIGRTNISTNYTIDDSSVPALVGLWKVYRGTRNSAGATAAASPVSRRDASIWVHRFESRGRDKEAVVAQARKEASALARLRHPCVLEVIEPLEETRVELTFATEPIVAPLRDALTTDHRADVQLDEVEVQKGLLTVARALEFLHQANMVHCNLTPDSILINAKGDWKLAGFGFLAPLQQADGTPTPWSFPEYDASLPSALSRDWDYLAPEYALDEQLLPANDLYSLGCVVYAANSKGQPPFRNRHAASTLRSNTDSIAAQLNSTQWSRLGRDLLDLLAGLLTRYPGSRLSATQFQSSNYFNNILVSTLKFMERDTFAGRQKEERVSFLKGLLRVLPQFSDRLLRRKVMPALLELMADRSLLPFILPNVFFISKNLSLIEFQTNVLPKLEPLFALTDPPQNQLLLLDEIELFVGKTTPEAFRFNVTPLLYASLESDSATVQERALSVLPRLLETMGFAHVKDTLLPRVAALFSRTKVLSVKCNTLITFHAMVDTLDRYTLTEKLVPLLARIKTKEPSVMMASLAVYVAMASKVERETLGAAILPQLWMMSMTPMLSADQFTKFMQAITEMGSRVQREQLAHLQDVKRMQEHTDRYVGGGGSSSSSINAPATTQGGEVDFATLVGSASASGTPAPKDLRDAFSAATSIPTAARTTITPTLTPSHTGGGGGGATTTLALTPTGASLGGGGFSTPLAPSAPPARSRPTAPSPRPQLTSTNSSNPAASLFLSQPTNSSPLATAPSSVLSPGLSSGMIGTSSNNGALSLSGMGSSLPPLVPTTSSLGSLNSFSPQPTSNSSTSGGLPPLVPTSSSSSTWLGSTSHPAQPSAPPQGFAPGGILSPNINHTGEISRSASPASWSGGVLTPSKPPQPARSNAQASWADFDPLK